MSEVGLHSSVDYNVLRKGAWLKASDQGTGFSLKGSVVIFCKDNTYIKGISNIKHFPYISNEWL